MNDANEAHLHCILVSNSGVQTLMYNGQYSVHKYCGMSHTWNGCIIRSLYGVCASMEPNIKNQY